MSKEPLLEIDVSMPTPVYRQIASGLRRLLVQPKGLRPGDRLPPVRRLAADLGVHHNTVASAYRLLAEEGWLALVRGRGAVVLDRERPKPSTPTSQGSFRRRMEELVSEALGAGASKKWLEGELRALQAMVKK